jgi:hypothetical protein
MDPAAIRSKLDELATAEGKAQREVDEALAALGERIVEDGEGNANASGALRAARERLDGIRAAIAAARTRLEAAEAAEHARTEQERWRQADALSDALVQAATALDATLAQAAPQWQRLLELVGQLAAASPAPIESHVGYGRTVATWDLACERYRLPTKSTYRVMHGELADPPNAQDFARGVVEYLNSRRPEALRKAA